MSAAIETLGEYVRFHAERGACQCGKCIDAPGDPEKHQPGGHTADLVFFKVRAVNAPYADVLTALVKGAPYGDSGDDAMEVFDGKEHNYIELGAWLGDQGLALMLMGLGKLLGLWELLTPITVLKLDPSDPLVMQMAGAGMVSIRAKAEAPLAQCGDDAEEIPF